MLCALVRRNVCLHTGVHPHVGTFTLQGAQSVVRNPPKVHPCCNPPQFAIRHTLTATSLHAFGA
eukprot:5313730-Alexandrium_andersonii.AAC.1